MRLIYRALAKKSMLDFLPQLSSFFSSFHTDDKRSVYLIEASCYSLGHEVAFREEIPFIPEHQRLLSSNNSFNVSRLVFVWT